MQLPWLGARSYLHGTTLLEAMRAKVPADAALFFRVPQIIRSDRVRLVDVEAPARASSDKASLLWRTSASAGQICAEPLAPTDVPRREPYDESAVDKLLQRLSDEVALEGGSPFGLVATLVPMMKALLAHRVMPPGAGKWLFVRFEVGRYPLGFATIRLSLDAILNRGQLARGRFVVDQSSHGIIDFSWGTDQIAPRTPEYRQ